MSQLELNCCVVMNIDAIDQMINTSLILSNYIDKLRVLVFLAYS